MCRLRKTKATQHCTWRIVAHELGLQFSPDKNEQFLAKLCWRRVAQRCSMAIPLARLDGLH